MGFIQKLLGKTEVEEKSFSNIILGDNGYILDGNSGFKYETQYQDNKLINEGYISNVDVYAVVKKLCEVGSDVPFVVEYLNGDEWEVDEDSGLNQLLEQPNEIYTGKDFRFNTLLYLLNTGDIFWSKLQGAFDIVTSLELLPSNLVEIELDFRNLPKQIVYENFDGTESIYGLDDVIHVRYFNPSRDGLYSHRGLSPLQAAYNSLTASNNRQTAQAHIYENRGATNLISSGSDVALMPTEREEIQKQTDKILGGAKNFNKSIVSTKNLTVTPLGMSATDLKLIEAKDLDLRDICNAYAVPSNMFNDKSASTESNVKTDLKKFYSDAVIPNNEKILAAFNKMIVPAYSAFENKQLRIVQDTSGIEALQSDQKMKAEKDAININNILSIMDSVSLSPEQKTNLLNQMGYEL